MPRIKSVHNLARGSLGTARKGRSLGGGDKDGHHDHFMQELKEDLPAADPPEERIRVGCSDGGESWWINRSERRKQHKGKQLDPLFFQRIAMRDSRHQGMADHHHDVALFKGLRAPHHRSRGLLISPTFLTHHSLFVVSKWRTDLKNLGN